VVKGSRFTVVIDGFSPPSYFLFAVRVTLPAVVKVLTPYGPEMVFHRSSVA
jgi:hypothetical protein